MILIMFKTSIKDSCKSICDKNVEVTYFLFKKGNSEELKLSFPNTVTCCLFLCDEIKLRLHRVENQAL